MLCNILVIISMLAALKYEKNWDAGGCVHRSFVNDTAAATFCLIPAPAVCRSMRQNSYAGYIVFCVTLEFRFLQTGTFNLQ